MPTSRLQRITEKLEDIFGTIRDANREISEVLNEDEPRAFTRSIRNGVFEFNRVESDIRQIQKNLVQGGSKILGSYLILTKESETFRIEVQIYTERNEQLLRVVGKCGVTRILQLPTDIERELASSAVVKLYLKFDE